MNVPESIRWLTLGEADVSRLGAAVAGALASRPSIAAAYLYGSVARGRPARDIDIGLVGDSPSASSVDLAAIANDIAVAMALPASDLDVRMLNGADPVFLGNVMRDGQLLFERDRRARVRFEVHALNQWFDFRPAWERVRSRVLAKWSDG